MQPLVGLIVGSRSDWETLGHAAQTLEALGVPCEVKRRREQTEAVLAHPDPREGA
jgi:phosphoribosylcarboxyaminoimidazole (NCAIR) mutase